LNHYPYAQNNPVRYVDPRGEFIIIAIGIAIVGYGIYEGLSSLTEKADKWGNAYSNVLDTAGNPNQLSGQYEQATTQFINATSEVQRETLKVAVTTPGTSIGLPVSAPSTWKDLAFDVFVDRSWSIIVDLLIDSKRSSHQTILRKPLDSFLPNWGYRGGNWQGPLGYSGGGFGGGGGGGWGGPPSEGK
jgi:hypothetical protein